MPLKLPRPSTTAFRRLPGHRRAAIAQALIDAIDKRERFRFSDTEMGRRVQAKWRQLTRADRAVLALLLAADPDLPRHLARRARDERAQSRR